MLEFIRKYAQGFIAWVIFVMLILAFALWGIQSYFSPSASNDVAKVNGEGISAGELQTGIQMYQARLRSIFGDRYDPRMFSQQAVKQSVMQSLIDATVLAQAATKAGLWISDAQLSAAIRAHKEFQRNGIFNEALYQRLLSNQGMSPGRFEQSLRRAMLTGQLSDGVTDTALVTDSDLKIVAQIQNQERDFGYLTVPVKRFTDQVKVDDQEIKKRYDRNPSRFSVPAQVSIDYLDLSVDDLAKRIKPTDAELHKYYDDHAGQFKTEETRHAAHILIAVPKDADKKAQESARAKAEEVLKKVKQGQPFDKLAKQYSDDPGSARQGGDLGFFGRGVMDPAFEKAVFSLSPGQVSGLVRTQFGYHIIKLLGIKPGKTKSFAEVRDQLEKDYRKTKAEDRFYDLNEKLENLTYEHPNTLKDAAAALGLQIESTGFFSRNSADGNAIAAHPEVRKAAFSDDVLNNNYNSLPVELTSTHTVILRKKDYKPSSVRPLKDVADTIANEIKREKAADKAREYGKTLIESLKKGGDPKTLAAKDGLQWQRTGLISRDDKQVDQTLVQTIFKQPKPDGKPVIGGVALPQGGYAVFALYAFKEGDYAAMKEPDRKSLKQAVAGNAKDLQYQMLLQSLKNSAKIKINKANL